MSLSSTSVGSNRLRSFLRRGAVLATAVTAGLAALTVGTVAEAATIPNSPRVHLNSYPIPAQPPGYITAGDLLPTNDGTLGNPVAIYMTGSAGNGTDWRLAISIPDGSPNWGTQVRAVDTIVGTAQTWYFQRVGYIGLATPQVDGVNSVAGAPVYKIINYNPTNGSHTCLDAFGGNGAAFSAVGSYGCDPNESNQTNQLWVVASSEQRNYTFNPSTGQFDGGSVTQNFSPTLQQAKNATATGLENSVLLNVASLQANNWDTTQTPVLSAGVQSVHGINSTLELRPQTEFPASWNNSTWKLVPSYAFNAANTPTDKCAGVKGVAALACGGTYKDYRDAIDNL